MVVDEVEYAVERITILWNSKAKTKKRQDHQWVGWKGCRGDGVWAIGRDTDDDMRMV